MAEETNEIALHHPTKKTNSGLIFYRSCVVNTQSFSVGHNILLRDENRNKLGYLLKIYCRTKGNERALVRWYFTDADLDGEKQVCGHEVFATSYTGKVAISSIRKLVHIRFEKNQHDIPTSVPKDIYYVFRYFDHEKQCLVPHEEQLIKVRYMPKPEPDSAGSALSGANILEDMKAETKLYSPYVEGGFKYYKVCMVGKQRYNVGDCVLLTERDGSSMRRITRFSYSQHKASTAMGQFIYFQNELTLSEEQRNYLHPQEVVTSNWQSELLMSNVRRRIHLQHLNIFQPVPQNSAKNIYYLKRFYEPFKKKLFPLLQPLNKSDLSIIPEPAEEPDEEAVLCEDDGGVIYRCMIGEDKFDVGEFVSLQSGSAIGRVLKFCKEDNDNTMSVLHLYTQRELPSVIRELVLCPSQLVASDEIYTMSCHLYFDTVSVDLGSSSPVDGSYIVDNFYDIEKNELYSLKCPLTIEDIQKIPERGDLMTDSASSSYSDDQIKVEEKRKRGDRKKNEQRKRVKQPQEKNDDEKEVKVLRSPEKKTPTKPDKAKEKQEIKVKEEEEKEVKLAQFQKHQKEQNQLISDLQEKQVKLSEVHDHNQYSWAIVGSVKACVGDCVFVKLVEGIQMGRIISIYKDLEGVMRLKMFRYYLEEEMFVTPKESRTIHINEVFACDFVIYALLCQLDELVDVIYLKRKERIPLQKDIPKGRLYVRRYYHPIKHIMRTLKTPLDAKDLSIVAQPNPPIMGTFNKSLNIEVSKLLNTSATIEDSVEQIATPAKPQVKRKRAKTALFQAITNSLADVKMSVESKVVETPSTSTSDTPSTSTSDNIKESVKPIEEKADIDPPVVPQTIQIIESMDTDATNTSIQIISAAVPSSIQIIASSAPPPIIGNKPITASEKDNNPIQVVPLSVEDSQIEISENQSQIPVNQIQISESQMQLPTNQIQLSESQIQIPSNQIQISESQIQIPTNQIQKSESQIQIPPNQFQIAEGQIQISESQIQIPMNQIQISQSQIQIPSNQILISESQIEIPTNQILISESQIEIPTNQIQICESQIQIPTNQIQISESQIQIPTSQIQISESQIQIPTNQIQISESQIQIPTNQVQISESQIQIPTNQIQISEGQIEIPTNQIQISESQIQIPMNQIQISESQIEIPTNHLQISESQIKIPMNEIQISENQIQISESQIQIPTNQIQISESQIQIPTNQIQISESQIQIPTNQVQISESQIQIPTNLIQISESQIQISESQIQIPTNQIQISASQIQIPTNQIQISESQIQIPMNQIQISESQIQVPTNQIQISESQIQIPTNQIQISESQIQIPTNQIQIPTNQIQISESQIQIPTNQIQISENQIRIPTNQIQISDSHIQISESQVQIPTNQIQISESQIQIPTNQIQISESQIRIPTNQIQISESQIQISESQIQIPTNQIQISESQIQISESQVQIIQTSDEGEQDRGETAQIEIIPSDSSSEDPVEQRAPVVPSIISSEQPLDNSLSVDICHSSDGSITIAPIQSILTTAKFEDSYTENGKTRYRKCHFKEETISQGDTVYIRCGDTDTESWKIGRIMEFYHNDQPCVRVMWFYGEEEMVVSKNELAGIHAKEIFASTCFDEVELRSIESQVSVVYLQKGESIPKEIPTNTLYCKRFYDPYRHMIRQLKTRLTSHDVSVLPEPAKRPRSEKIFLKNTDSCEELPQTKKLKIDLEEALPALVPGPLDVSTTPLIVSAASREVSPLDVSQDTTETLAEKENTVESTAEDPSPSVIVSTTQEFYD